MPPTLHPVAAAFNKILDEASAKFLERRACLEAVIIAMLARANFFILGPPGTAKSQLCREIFGRITASNYFESLLSRTRPDAAILGPYNLPDLRDKGDFHRKTAGFLPEANFAFLDEIGKMSPTLGHDLLSLLNEHLYHEVNGGRSARPVDLYCAGTASNELITDQSDDAAALWDRLLVRTYVDYIQESGNFALLLQSAVDLPTPVGTATTDTTVDFEDYRDVVDNVIPVIDVPVNVQETVIKLREHLRQQEIVPSDRRWKHTIRLMQAAAFLSGRSQVEDDDVTVARYALWDIPSQIDPVERTVLSLSNPVAEAAMKLLDDVEKIATGIRDRKGQSIEARSAFGTEANGKLKVVLAELAQKRQECIAAGRSATKLDEVADRVKAVQRSIYIECLDMSPEIIR